MSLPNIKTNAENTLGWMTGAATIIAGVPLHEITEKIINF